jgi:hypothetical protein
MKRRLGGPSERVQPPPASASLTKALGGRPCQTRSTELPGRSRRMTGRASATKEFFSATLVWAVIYLAVGFHGPLDGSSTITVRMAWFCVLWVIGALASGAAFVTVLECRPFLIRFASFVAGGVVERVVLSAVVLAMGDLARLAMDPPLATAALWVLGVNPSSGLRSILLQVFVLFMLPAMLIAVVDRVHRIRRQQAVSVAGANTVRSRVESRHRADAER